MFAMVIVKKFFYIMNFFLIGPPLGVIRTLTILVSGRRRQTPKAVYRTIP